jgi:hypothetical protein
LQTPWFLRRQHGVLQTPWFLRRQHGVLQNSMVPKTATWSFANPMVTVYPHTYSNHI